jgi:putative addiction module component (TIGR02574 family)
MNMTQEVSELLKKALALPAEARVALAGSLLDSLDNTLDASAEEEWSREIARRIAELDSGKVKPVPGADARRQISAILNGR